MGKSNWHFGFYKPKAVTTWKFAVPKIGTRAICTVATDYGHTVKIMIWNGEKWINDLATDGRVICYTELEEPYMGGGFGIWDVSR